jgi:hypothetical protein
MIAFSASAAAVAAGPVLQTHCGSCGYLALMKSGCTSRSLLCWYVEYTLDFLEQVMVDDCRH